MAFVEINPRYRPLLAQAGLTAPEHFLALPAVIVSGHPDRHVARVTVGAGSAAVAAFLKREHRVPWRDRLANAWAGFGFVSKSRREAQTLRALSQAGVACPEWLAAGEDGQGRAFLLLRGLAGALDLRDFLRRRCGAPPREQFRLARTLGEALARTHRAGFNHPDLYAKHVLVAPDGKQVHFIDWQRTRRRTSVPWRTRWRDLAALDATLAEELAPRAIRRTCLRAYLSATVPARDLAAELTRSLDRIRARAHRLLHKRHVRDQRAPPLPPGAQDLLWLDGEALCVTGRFWGELRGGVPDWLPLAPAAAGWAGRTDCREVELPGGRRGLLVRRWRNQPLGWLWAALRGGRPASPELRQAAALFRLQRQGGGAARLLAFGQRRAPPWRTESFLLTEVPSADAGRDP